MTKPVLVIMAAGMGSRYGGLKQIDPVDNKGHIIIDYSIYDAVKAGFEKVIFIIKEENEKDFREAIGDRISDKVEVVYANQNLLDLPNGVTIPEGRVKPWGTAHAIYAARKHIQGPFAVINADDFYGRTSFSKIYDFLSTTSDDDKYRYAMIGYKIENTVTENGYVSRGVCEVDEDNNLVEVIERTRIEKLGDQNNNEKIAFTEDDGKTWTELNPGTLVSMNLWGFNRSFVDEIELGLEEYLNKNLKANPLKCEYFIPYVVSNLLEQNKATVKVLISDEKWYGVTYKEDKPMVEASIKQMKEDGKYPEKLWD